MFVMESVELENQKLCLNLEQRYNFPESEACKT
jgi:hypothetical protein